MAEAFGEAFGVALAGGGEVERDGAGGLCTRHRVSPYALAAAGMPLGALPQGNYPLEQLNKGPQSKPQFLQVTSGSKVAA